MKEIEILVEVLDNDVNYILKILNEISVFISEDNVNDIYFYDTKRNNLKPDENYKITQCFRLRKKGDVSFVTYKNDKFDINGKWLYSDEYETQIADLDTMICIVKNLGLKKLVTVNMTKYFFETEEYNIALEVVENLGLFLEVEAKIKECVDVYQTRKNINNFIKKLTFKTSEEVNAGKPELLLKKIGVEEK